jgi:hypothetical protein
MKHILSKEQQLFYKKVTELILSTASIFSTSEIQKTLTKPPAIPISQILQSPGPQTTPTQITSVTNVQNVQNVQATMPTTLPVSSTQSQPQLLTPTATTTIPSTGTTHITPAIWAAASTAVLEATFRIIASESGLQQLLPYFTKFISEEVNFLLSSSTLKLMQTTSVCLCLCVCLCVCVSVSVHIRSRTLQNPH